MTKIFLGLLLFVFSNLMASDLKPVINVFNGRGVLVWNHGQDSTQMVYAAIGTYGVNPATWPVTELTDGQSFKFVRDPKLFTNGAGDIVVVWERCELDDSFILLAAVLPVGSSTWSTQVISASNTVVGFADFKASIDGQNVFVVWSALDDSTSQISLWGATTTIGSSPTWNTFQIN